MFLDAFTARTLAKTLSLEGDEYPIIVIEGMHRVGKTTLARSLFEDMKWVDLSDWTPRNVVRTSPKDFFKIFGTKLVIDNIDATPEFLHFIPSDGSVKLVIVGNILDRKVRSRLTEEFGAKFYRLTPMSLREQQKLDAEPFGRHPIPVRIGYPSSYFLDMVRNGFLPRSQAQQTSFMFYDSWMNSFNNEVVRDAMRVAKEAQFRRYLEALARSNMQELNHYQLAEEAGMSYGTAMYWTEFLIDAGVIAEVPSLKLAQRRQVKRPKVIFMDTGLLCYLLDIRTNEDLLASPYYEAIIEGFVAAEIMKGYEAWGEKAPLTFYRDTAKKHINLVLKAPRGYLPIGFLTTRAREEKITLREMRVLERMGETVIDPVLFTDGSIVKQRSEIALVAPTAL